MKKLLLKESPLNIYPLQAVVFGLNEAIFLQQLNYWAEKKGVQYEDRLWVENAFGQWCSNFPWWSKSTIQRTVAKLKKDQLIMIAQINKSKGDTTNWYSLNDELIRAKEAAELQDENTSEYLLDQEPLTLLPTLACIFELNEALVLQQIHYWVKKSGHPRDGRLWVYNTFGEWQTQFPFWSESTVRRIIYNLRNLQVLLLGNYNKMVGDKTNWYSIDYENVRIYEKRYKATGETAKEQLKKRGCGQIEQMGASTQNDHRGACGQSEQIKVWSNRADGMVNLSRPIPETITETTETIYITRLNTTELQKIWFGRFGTYLPQKVVDNLVEWNREIDARIIYEVFMQMGSIDLCIGELMVIAQCRDAEFRSVLAELCGLQTGLRGVWLDHSTEDLRRILKQCKKLDRRDVDDKQPG